MASIAILKGAVVQIVLDGYALRFPRTGIVSYGYAVAKGYQQRLRKRHDLKILLGDRNVTDGEIKEFLTESQAIPILESNKEDFIERLRRKIFKKNENPFAGYMAGLDSAIQRSTRGCDVFHCIDWFMYPSRAAKINAMTYFDLTTTLFPQFHEEMNIEKEKFRLKMLNRYDVVFTISQSTRNDLLKHSTIDPKKVVVNYIDTDEIYNNCIYKSRAEIASKYRIPEGYRYLLSVSTIEPRKNFQKVLEAFSTFLNKNPGERYVLLCTGLWGWKNDELNEYLRKCDFSDRVIFTGFADNADLPSLYHHADCFLYLSFYEGFGLPILEAMKSRCPVVCSDTSSMPEVVGDTGVLVPPDDTEAIVRAIETVVFDPAAAEKMRERALERSSMFSWKSHVDMLLRCYAEAM